MYEKIQNSFSGGAIRPELWHRTDLPAIQSGLKTCENAIITDTGSWAMRPGSIYKSEVRDEANVYSYLSSNGNQFYFQFQDDYVYVLNSDYSDYSIDDVLSDWDGDSHPDNELVRIGFFHEYVLSNQYLKIFSSYSYSRIITISISTNDNDSLSVSFSGSTLTIKIANTTHPKNTIALIQAAIRSIGVQGIYHFDDIIVKGDFTWSNPPIYGSDSHTFTSFNTMNMRGLYSVSDSYNPIYMGHNLQGAYYHGKSGDELSKVKLVTNGNTVYFTMPTSKPFSCVEQDRGAEYFEFDTIGIESGPYTEIGKTDFSFSGNVIDSSKLIADINSLSTVINTKITDSQYIGSGLYDSFIKTFSTISSFEFHFYGSSNGTNAEWHVDFITNGTITWNYTDPGNGIIKLFYSKDGLTFIDTGVTINGNNAMYSLDSQCIYRLQWPLNTTGNMLFTVASESFISEGIYKIGNYSSGSGKHLLTCIKWGNPLYFSINNYPTPGGNTLFYQISTETKNYISVFNAYFGYPRLVYFFQNRLGFACSDKFPYTKWESKVGEYLNFDLTFPVLNSGPINSEIVSGENEQIYNIYEFDSLLIFTNKSVWKFKLSDSGYGPLSPLIKKRVSKIGSADIAPININQTLYYIDSTRKNIQSINLTVDSENYSVNEISLYFKHLLDNYTILDITHTKNPFDIIWLLRSDGKLLSITVIGNNFACALHDLGGEISGIESSEIDGYELAVTINRDSGYFIETINLDNLLNFDENDTFVRCDSSSVFNLDSPTTTFTGLTSLKAKSVCVLADGYSIAGKTVSDIGVVTLDSAFSDVVIGLPYTAKFEPIHHVYDRNTGSGHAIEQSIPRIKVRFLKSVSGYIGSSPNSKRRIPTRQTDPTVPDSPFTGWNKLEIYSTYTTNENFDESQLYYEQRSPLPAQISAIIMDIE